MTDRNTATSKKLKMTSDTGIYAGLVIVLLFFVITGFISYANTRTLIENNQRVTHTHEVLTALDDLISLMKDAETGQRGYVLTGDDNYLLPYTAALSHIDQKLSEIDHLVEDNLDHVVRLGPIKKHAGAKLKELEQTVNLRRTDGFEAALAVVLTDRGKGEMDALRTQVTEMQNKEQEIREMRINEMRVAYNTAIFSGMLTGALGILLSLSVSFLMRRSAALRRKQEWLQAGQLGLGTATFGDLRVEQIGENVLKFLAAYFDAHAGAFFVKDGDTYRRVATYGVPAGANVPVEFGINDGLLGQAAKEDKTFIVRDVPDGYLSVGSALGQSTPRHLIISSAAADGMANAVLELGFIHQLDEDAIELLERVSETISVAVRSANYRLNLQNFLEETQRQSEELQAQGEELRVSNEELEEQGRVLKESQSRLEQQQAELEETNAQLEEQTQQLEAQRDDLAHARDAVEIKAQELEQASRYKSDFLANMSHELRTPLNSSLILAKLLADNPDGNLTAEQVKHALTIQSSGNDLLLLINDILDLSKIEAGHMDVTLEEVSLARVASDLNRVFQPLAGQKKLTFTTKIAEGTPETIDTDRQRLEQILKNLLSNGIKFTEKGSVTLAIGSTKDGRISFAITDTGIGISKEQQQSVFEAFRQADSTISRKYGGTGLGLSISRELARLLGGAIELVSTPGEGSTFTLVLPRTYEEKKIVSRSTNHGPVAPPSAYTHKDVPAAVHKHVRRFNDDREKLTSNERVLLMVEDDESFARILSDLAHEMNFQCLLASTAEEALAVARQYMPSAVVLDIGLPDNSGLTVLDRLKHDPRTRHIPVHVVSAEDYSQKAMSLGAIGYMLKPVKRDELQEAFKSLETKLAQRMRRVLVVEDDLVQRESIGKLLATVDVKTVGVGTAAECLEHLKNETFDCMVLDLSLPDSSGYALLETLSDKDAYSFPPVIVYTGRDLSSDEERQLRRYSKSIIIKGAKSPERLLDEVTLFLHQVVSDMPQAQQKMLEKARNRDAALEGRRILVVEDDIRNVYALTNILEPAGAIVEIARNGREAIEMLEKGRDTAGKNIDLVLMDVMMPEVDGLTATREIRKRPEWKKLPVIMLTAKAMKDDQERCLDAGANDYMAKPIDVEKLLSLVRVWMPR